MSTSTEGVIIAALGVAVVETFKMYRDTAPSLESIRRATPGDVPMRQLLMDADILGLVVVAVVGGGGSFLVSRWYPLVLCITAWIGIAGYYHSVLNSSNEGMFND
jgi:hypothetical protein